MALLSTVATDAAAAKPRIWNLHTDRPSEPPHDGVFFQDSDGRPSILVVRRGVFSISRIYFDGHEELFAGRKEPCDKVVPCDEGTTAVQARFGHISSPTVAPNGDILFTEKLPLGGAIYLRALVRDGTTRITRTLLNLGSAAVTHHDQLADEQMTTFLIPFAFACDGELLINAFIDKPDYGIEPIFWRLEEAEDHTWSRRWIAGGGSTPPAIGTLATELDLSNHLLLQSSKDLLLMHRNSARIVKLGKDSAGNYRVTALQALPTLPRGIEILDAIKEEDGIYIIFTHSLAADSPGLMHVSENQIVSFPYEKDNPPGDSTPQESNFLGGSFVRVPAGGTVLVERSRPFLRLIGGPGDDEIDKLINRAVATTDNDGSSMCNLALQLTRLEQLPIAGAPGFFRELKQQRAAGLRVATNWLQVLPKELIGELTLHWGANNQIEQEIVALKARIAHREIDAARTARKLLPLAHYLPPALAQSTPKW